MLESNSNGIFIKILESKHSSKLKNCFEFKS